MSSNRSISPFMRFYLHESIDKSKLESPHTRFMNYFNYLSNHRFCLFFLMIQGHLIVYLNDTYYQLAQRHPEVPRMTPEQTEV